jgi:cobalt-precorrin-5B (C1)-methyltransferase
MGKLRSGFTTGACAAAAAKAATLILLSSRESGQVEIPFPNGDRHCFTLYSSSCRAGQARVSIIKDAGDDPDVTNGAEIIASVQETTQDESGDGIKIMGGSGVGRVTKPGLATPVGEPAINPVPLQMIRQAVNEALRQCKTTCFLEVTISIVDGEQLARQTLNKRLGILGGLSILGTTGIVRPISASAWTDTIDAAMNVARAAEIEEVILSTGRTSEAAVEKLLNLPEEAEIMMGDYLAFALEAAARHGFSKIHLAGMWAKILKCALQIPQTHVRNGALEVQDAVDLLAELGLDRQTADSMAIANTAREIYQRLLAAEQHGLIRAVCRRAREYACSCSGLPVQVYLVTSEQGVVVHV